MLAVRVECANHLFVDEVENSLPLEQDGFVEEANEAVDYRLPDLIDLSNESTC